MARVLHKARILRCNGVLFLMQRSTRQRSGVVPTVERQLCVIGKVVLYVHSVNREQARFRGALKHAMPVVKANGVAHGRS